MIFKYFHSKFFRLFHEEKQTLAQNDQRYLDDLHIDNISFSFALSFCEPNGYNNCTKINLSTGTSIGFNIMINMNISTLDYWYEYEKNNGIQSIEQIFDLLQENQRKISELRGRPTIAYLASISRNDVDSNLIKISEEDRKGFLNLCQSISDDIREVDVILHSNGGYIQSVASIVEYLRERFDKVNFLIPFSARSAAAFMAMSGNEIVMTPESCFGPFDVQIETYDRKTYLPLNEMKQYIKEAKRAHMPINVFASKKLYEGISASEMRRATHDCDSIFETSREYAFHWLMKYMFKIDKKHRTNYFKNLFFYSKEYVMSSIKAHRIVSYFMSTKIHKSHNSPIVYSNIKDSGLKISLAEGEFLELLRETYHLADKIFERRKIVKIFISQKTYTYNFITDTQSERRQE